MSRLPTSRAGVNIPQERRIFTNRNLRMEDVDVIGFDMDYTLAQYKPRMEELSLELTVRKLVEQRGYPADIAGIDYDMKRAIRGLVVDMKEGNLLKMDRYRHVGTAYHGMRRLTREERQSLYRAEPLRLSNERYAWLDTLFALPEAAIYVHLIDYFEGRGKTLDYRTLWEDIRFCIDQAHSDNTLKDEIRANLADYIIEDPDLPSTLHRLRSSGKRLFLLTNSDYSYSNAVMTYLLDGKVKSAPSWVDFFDVVVVSGAKPSFFGHDAPFLEIDRESGRAGDAPVAKPFELKRIYQGGNLAQFESLADCRGDRVLYIGDHIYGDMLRAKKSSIWRTVLVIQELEHELAVTEKFARRVTELVELDRTQRNLDAEIDFQHMLIDLLHRGAGAGAGSVSDDSTAAMAMELAQRHLQGTLTDLEQQRDKIIASFKAGLAELDQAHNPYWGPVFKLGVENSRFGEQVENYACLYTSRVSNFLAYSPLRYFRSPRTLMPHEL